METMENNAHHSPEDLLTIIKTLKEELKKLEYLKLQESELIKAKEDAEIETRINGDQIHRRLEEFETNDGISYWEWVLVEYNITIYTLNTVVNYDSGTIAKGVISDE